MLGKGNVGTSYKTVLEEGTTMIVKRLKDATSSKREFEIICGSTARNVAGANETEMTEKWNDLNDFTATATAVTAGIRGAESRNFWQGHRFLNFLLASMVFAFVISWLFHFNIPS